MNHYELLFILPGTLSEDEVKPAAEKVRLAVEENGGAELTVTEPDKKRLAYPIKHIRYGYFQLAYFQAAADRLKDIRKQLGLMPELLRFLVKKCRPRARTIGKINFGQPAAETARVEVKSPERRVEAGAPAEIFSEEEKMKQAPVKRGAAKKTDKKKVKLDEIDQKLDEILDIDLDKV